MRLRTFALLASILGMCAPFFAPCVAQAADSYTVNNGATTDITEHAVCMRVTNNHASGQKIFVPTKTSPEWASFYGSPPPGVTVVACPAACGGVSAGGYCWYLGTSNASCDTACASYGGCNLAGTRDYVGTGGSFANCASVANGFGSFISVGDNGGSAPMGCFVRSGGVHRLIGSTTNCSQGDIFGGQRVCACNN